MLTKIIITALKYIKRNKGLSIATIIVITITFLLGNLSLMLNFVASKTADYLESQPTLSILYDPKEKMNNIEALKEYLEKDEKVKSVEIRDSEDMQRDYLKAMGIPDDEFDFYMSEEYRIKILRIKLEPNVEIDPYLNLAKDEKNKGAQIIKILFFKDIAQKIKQFSNAVKLVGVAITLLMVFISVVLIYLTISFSINRFATEIEIMQLVGAEPNVVIHPFSLQGAFYGMAAASLSYTIVSLLILAIFSVLRNNVIFLFIRNISDQIGITNPVNLLPNLILLGVCEVIIGGLLGFICSYIVAKKYIK